MDEICDFVFKSQIAVRENLRASKKEFNKTEDDLKSLQSVGQIIGEVLRPLDNERCNSSFLLHAISSCKFILIISTATFRLSLWITCVTGML